MAQANNTQQGAYPPSVIQLLMGAMGQPNSMGSPQDALGPATIKQLGNVGADTQQATGPYQKGVAKALQEYGHTHATQALQAGMSPQAIQSHDLMTGGAGGAGGAGGGMTPQAMAVLQALMGGQSGGQRQPGAAQGGAGQAPPPGQGGQPQVTPPQNPFSQPGFNLQTGNIQQGGFVNRGLRGLAAGGIPGLLSGLVGPSATQQMSALGTAQELKAGQPSKIGEPQAQANLANAQAENWRRGPFPIAINPATGKQGDFSDPNTQVFLAHPSWGGLQVEPLDTQKSTSYMVDSLGKILNVLSASRGGWQKTFGIPTEDMNKIQNDLQNTATKLMQMTGVGNNQGGQGGKSKGNPNQDQLVQSIKVGNFTVK